jgi:hypothetical protein
MIYRLAYDNLHILPGLWGGDRCGFKVGTGKEEITRWNFTYHNPLANWYRIWYSQSIKMTFWEESFRT